MRIPLSWLRELVRFELDAQALGERLTLGGIEVEAIESLGADVAGVVVARIDSVDPHPAASRLSLCRVSAGEGRQATVVCGATNMKAGDRVAWAMPGASLPGGRRIETAVIRGQRSEGMLCSGAEIGASDDESGLLILPPDTPLGADVGDVLGLRDTVLEVGVTPNRGDCLSILGIAREVVALAGGRLVDRPLRVSESPLRASDRIAVEIQDPDGCRRYAARYVRGVRVGPSPVRVQQRLRAAGVRPISNVVDATNYVMLERGQPLHAFDAGRLPGLTIGIRRARPHERMRTLDDVDRALTPEDLVITAADVPVAIAGVMGGADSEVRSETTELLLESAWFDPSSIRRTARRLGIASEAAYRFERGTDIEGVPAALDRVAQLIVEWAGGEVAAGQVDCCPRPHEPVRIGLRPKRVRQLLGCALPRGRMLSALRRLGAAVEPGERGRMTVAVPSFRRDLREEIDLVEEIARVVGYGAIPASMPESRLALGELPPRQRVVRTLEALLTAQGLHQAVPMTFTAPEMNRLFPGFHLPDVAVRIVNPLTHEESELRRSLLPGLIEAVRANRRAAVSGAGLFVIGKVFGRASAQEPPEEPWRIGGALDRTHPLRHLGGQRTADFYDIKGLVELVLEKFRVADRVAWERADGKPFLHPGKSARVLLEGRTLGVVGALHPEVEASLDLGEGAWFFELDLDRLVAEAGRQPLFRGLPRFPAVTRDLAIVVPADFPAATVLRVVREMAHPLIESVELFDEYRGDPVPPDRKSLAYSIAYRATDRTLTDEEVNRLHDEIVAVILDRSGAELR